MVERLFSTTAVASSNSGFAESCLNKRIVNERAFPNYFLSYITPETLSASERKKIDMEMASDSFSKTLNEYFNSGRGYLSLEHLSLKMKDPSFGKEITEYDIKGVLRALLYALDFMNETEGDGTISHLARVEEALSLIFVRIGGRPFEEVAIEQIPHMTIADKNLYALFLMHQFRQIPIFLGQEFIDQESCLCMLRAIISTMPFNLLADFSSFEQLLLDDVDLRWIMRAWQEMCETEFEAFWGYIYDNAPLPFSLLCLASVGVDLRERRSGWETAELFPKWASRSSDIEEGIDQERRKEEFWRLPQSAQVSIAALVGRPDLDFQFVNAELGEAKLAEWLADICVDSNQEDDT